jgi:hypothetical protein
MWELDVRHDGINLAIKATKNVEALQPVHEGKVLEDIGCYMWQVEWVVRRIEHVLIGAFRREPANIVTENLGSIRLEIYRNGMQRFILRSRGHLCAFEMLRVLTWFNNGRN